MKLGIWNRLAVVVTTLACLICPTWLVVSSNYESRRSHQEGYEACVARAMEPNDGTLTAQACSEIWPAGGQLTSYGMAEWWNAAFATFVACVVAYGVLALAAAVGKWVWRGRKI